MITLIHKEIIAVAGYYAWSAFIIFWGVGGGGVGEWVYGPFKNISLILNRSYIKGGRKPENPGKNHQTIHKQNLAFSHVTRARLEPQ